MHVPYQQASPIKMSPKLFTGHLWLPLSRFHESIVSRWVHTDQPGPNYSNRVGPPRRGLSLSQHFPCTGNNYTYGWHADTAIPDILPPLNGYHMYLTQGRSLAQRSNWSPFCCCNHVMCTTHTTLKYTPTRQEVLSRGGRRGFRAELNFLCQHVSP